MKKERNKKVAELTRKEARKEFGSDVNFFNFRVFFPKNI